MRAIIGAVLGAVLLLTIHVDAIPGSFPTSIQNVLKSEGGYSNLRADPGGPTNWGITIHDATLYGAEFGWVAEPTAEDVRDMPLWFAEKVYEAKYWKHRCVRADLLPAGLDYSVFDYATNAGANRVGLVLRRLLGVNTDRCDVSDGLIAIMQRKGSEKMIRALSAERKQFYSNLIARRPSSEIFRQGWMKRANSVELKSLKMAGAPAIGLFGEEMDPEPAFGPGKAYVR